MAGQDFTDFARVNRESMAATLDWFDRYLTRHPDVQLVYRRHPSEWNSPALLALAEKHANFHVIFEYSVRQWIVAADDILIWMSTAIAEVYFAQKGCHVVRPQPIPHEFDPVIYQGAAALTSYEALEEALAAPHGSFPIAKEVIEGYFDPAPQPAYLRMVSELRRRAERLACDGFTRYCDRL